MISCVYLFTAEYFVHIIAENILLANFCEHKGTFVEHNKDRCWALECSIIGKNKSIICMCLCQPYIEGAVVIMDKSQEMTAFSRRQIWITP